MCMIRTTLPTKQAISAIVRAHRALQGEGKRPLSLRDFAAALSEVLSPYGGKVSHQSVKNWEDRVFLPSPFHMMQISMHAPYDWRRDFAEDVLAALQPDLYQPATQIGTQALAVHKPDVYKDGGRSAAAGG